MKLLLITFILITLHTGGAQALPGGGNEKKSGVRHYVKKGSTNPVAPYLTPETAADSIQKACNVADSGDVIYIMNGTYDNERIILKEGRTLLGESKSGVLLSYTNFNPYPFFYCINVEAACIVKNLSLYLWGSDYTVIGRNRPYMKNVTELLVEDINYAGVDGFMDLQSGTVNRVTTNGFQGHWLFVMLDSAFGGRRTLTVKNSDLTSNNSISLILARSNSDFELNFINCDVKSAAHIEYYKTIDCQYFSVNFSNCHFLYGDPGRQRLASPQDIYWPTSFINCSFTDFPLPIFTFWGFDPLTIKNCNFYGYDTLIRATNYDTNKIIFKYNLLSGAKKQSWMDNTNITGCDFPHRRYKSSVYVAIQRKLDRLSSAIHSGDPSILNPDGSRSDIGSLGGPLGLSYTYPDLPPKTVDTVFIEKNITSGMYNVSWPLNCEKDFKRYWVYAGLTRSNAPFYATTELNEIHIPVSSYPSSLEVTIMCEDTAGNISKELNFYPVFIKSLVSEVKEKEQTGSVIKGIYPNPNTGTATVNYVLAENSRVTLTVYDPTGKEVKSVLYYDPQNCGEYKQEIKLNSSGIYIVHLTIWPEYGQRKDFTEKVSVVK